MNNGFEEIRARLQVTRELDWDLLTLSAHNLDFIHLVDSLDYDETSAESAGSFPGGSAANTGFAAAKLGLRVSMGGIVGTDEDGQLLRNDLQSAGVNCDLLLEVQARPGSSTGQTRIYTEKAGTRRIFVEAGLNDRLASELRTRPDLEELWAKRARATRIFHCSSFAGARELELTEKTIGELPRQTVVSLAPGSLYSRLGLDRLSRMLSRVNLLFLYESHLDDLVRRRTSSNPKRMILNDKLQTLYLWRDTMGSREPLIVAVKKDGSSSFELAYGLHRMEAAVPPVSIPGDTIESGFADATGTRDAMTAGILLGLLRGMELNECADLGYAMAVLAGRRVGARPGLPDLAELSQFSALRIPA